MCTGERRVWKTQLWSSFSVIDDEVHVQFAEKRSLLVRRAFVEGGYRGRSEGHHIAHRIKPHLRLGRGLRNRALQLGDAERERFSPTKELCLADSACHGEVGEALEVSLGLGKLELACVHEVQVDNLFLLGPPVDGTDCPLKEGLGNREALKGGQYVGRDLFLPGSRREALLVSLAPSTAAVVDVHVALAVRVGLAHEEPAVAVPAVEEAGVREAVPRGARGVWRSDERLCPPELVGSDHRDVFALVDLALVDDLAGVERIVKQFVDDTYGDRDTGRGSRAAGREPPFPRPPPDIGHGESAFQELPPEALDDMETLRIRHDFASATKRSALAFLDVPEWRSAGNATAFPKGAVAALHTGRQVIGHLGGGAEKDRQHEFAVARARVGALRRHDLAEQALAEIVGQGAAVDGVSGEPVEHQKRKKGRKVIVKKLRVMKLRSDEAGRRMVRRDVFLWWVHRILV